MFSVDVLATCVDVVPSRCQSALLTLGSRSGHVTLTTTRSMLTPLSNGDAALAFADVQPCASSVTAFTWSAMSQDSQETFLVSAHANGDVYVFKVCRPCAVVLFYVWVCMWVWVGGCVCVCVCFVVWYTHACVCMCVCVCVCMCYVVCVMFVSRFVRVVSLFLLSLLCVCLVLCVSTWMTVRTMCVSVCVFVFVCVCVCVGVCVCVVCVCKCPKLKTTRSGVQLGLLSSLLML
jgi:hypothetical protein